MVLRHCQTSSKLSIFRCHFKTYSCDNFFYSVSMVGDSNAKIKIHIAVAEKLFRIGNDQVAMLR